MRIRNGLAVAIGFTTFVAFAGPLDDLKQSLSQGVSNAVSNATNAALGVVGQPANAASNGAPPRGSAGGAAAPSPSHTVNASAGNSLASGGAASGVMCISVETRGSSGTFRNTCSDPIIALIYMPGANRCNYGALRPGGGIQLGGNPRIQASCRKAGIMIKPGDCQCPTGTEITATSGTAPSAAPPKPPPVYSTDAFGCPTRDDDPRYRDIPKGSKCSR